MNLIILGPQGSGKGTQAKLLAAKLKIKHISTGNLLRQAAKEETPKGQLIKSLLSKGTLIPFETTLEVLEPVLKTATQGFILDGMPRDLRQAEHLEWLLGQIKQSIDRVVYITLSKKSSYTRLLKRAQTEGRADDTIEAIEKRLEIYHNQTLPVIEFFKKQGNLIEVDGEPDIDTIHQNILSKLVSTKSHSTSVHYPPSGEQKTKSVIGFLEQAVREKHGEMVDKSLLNKEISLLYTKFEDGLISTFIAKVPTSNKPELNKLINQSADPHIILDFLMGSIRNFEQKITQYLIDFKQDYIKQSQS